MASIINPTRMELTRLKDRLSTAARGHKLLKDKRDELMRRFWEIVLRNRELRAQVEENLKRANAALAVATAVMGTDMLEQSILYPNARIQVHTRHENLVGVVVPRYEVETKLEQASGLYPYGFAQTSGELDRAVESMAAVFAEMVELAEVEKTMQLLAEEIEKTRRRVNALEYVMIPEMRRNIRYIEMKLEENDRATKVRLMKVKDMMLEQMYGDGD
ncbi:MAG: V-type ATP synthase subunit D [Oscillospiraceae bacterium]|nr:V-type ATP synthase subunit D [Oscillospiraceae bacterium]